MRLAVVKSLWRRGSPESLHYKAWAGECQSRKIDPYLALSAFLERRMLERYGNMQPKGEIVTPSVSWLKNARRANGTPKREPSRPVACGENEDSARARAELRGRSRRGRSPNRNLDLRGFEDPHEDLVQLVNSVPSSALVPPASLVPPAVPLRKSRSCSNSAIALFEAESGQARLLLAMKDCGFYSPMGFVNPSR
jgi:hypothetical protein